MIEKKKILAITYYGRSGFVFFQSLFDDHPDCFTIPGTYISGFGEWFGKEKKDSKYISEKFCDEFPFLFDPHKKSKAFIPLHSCGSSPGIDLNFIKMGENKNESIYINENSFKTYLSLELKDLKEVNCLDFFFAINKAYALCLNKKWDKIKYIIFQLHSLVARRAYFLKEADVKIIQMIREPTQSCLSHLEHSINRVNRGSTNCKLKELLTTLNGYDINRELSNYFSSDFFKNKTRAFKLENLHLNSFFEMKKVCEWLKISWHDSLLKSTFDGKQFHNLRGATQVSGFNKVINAKKHENFVNELDRARLQLLFKQLYINWQYKIVNLKPNIMQWFKKFKLEEDDNFIDKIKNRIFMIKIFLKNIPFLRKFFFKKERIIAKLL